MIEYACGAWDVGVLGQTEGEWCWQQLRLGGREEVE
jgi:hypothetical protein